MTPELQEFALNRSRLPEAEHGSLPEEVRWFRVGKFSLTGSRLAFCDSWAAPNDEVQVRLEPGEYEVDLECFAYGNEVRVARVRLVPEGVVAERGKKLGDFGVDVGSAGVVDYVALRAFAEHHEAEWEAWLEEFYEKKDSIGYYDCPSAETAMFYTETGFGDGSYDVFELVSNGKAIGAEAVFLRPDQGYFEDDNAEDEREV